MPEMQATSVRSLGWEGPLEKGMPTHSSILAWRIPWTEESGGVQSVGPQSQSVLHDFARVHNLNIYFLENSVTCKQSHFLVK